MTERAFINLQKRVITFSDYHVGRQMVNRTRSNQIIHVKDSSDCEFVFLSNQRLYTVVIERSKNIKVTFLDSVVVVSRTVSLIDCDQVEVVIEDVDIRKLQCYQVTNSTVTLIQSEPVIDNQNIFWYQGCLNNKVVRAQLNHIELANVIDYYTLGTYNVQEDDDPEKLFVSVFNTAGECSSVLFYNGSFTQQGNEIIDRIRPFVATDEQELELDKNKVLEKLAEIANTPFEVSNSELERAYDEERQEFYDSEEELRSKVKQLATEIRACKHAVFYSGAGISTAANIPDFRGPNGLWTLREKAALPSQRRPLKTYPTLSHYAVTELIRRGLAKFVISTNMDALHVRSGLPLHLISEQHGNSHKERCADCLTPHFRQYNTLDTVTHTRSHLTGRSCKFCGGPLKDSIIHFSELVKDDDMMSAMYHARKSDLAIVLGTSMNVQPAASIPDKCFNNNGKLVVVNLQKTPYDNVAHIRIFAKIDDTMRMLMEELNIVDFDTTTDVLPSWDPKPASEDDDDEEGSRFAIFTNPMFIFAFLTVVSAVAYVGLRLTK